jgi:P-type Cu2+ transporter
MNTVTLPVKGLNFAGCAREIEKNLGKLEPIKQVEASYVSQTVTITYDESKLSEEQLHEMVKDCGFACGAPLTRFAEPLAIISRPTAATAAQPVMAHPAMEHHTPVEAPAKMELGIVDHSMMGHDMSDPAMARAMEADMRNRFFVSLILTIPVVLYSPLGVNLFKLHLPTPFGISPNWVLLVLATPIVWWGGWIFHSGALRALRNRTLDMNVLVSLGVLVAYFFSAFATFFAPQVETSYDAAAMLVTFVLFGHWMEMRSRRGSSDALNALLRLAPSQANVIGPDGEVRAVPVKQVHRRQPAHRGGCRKGRGYHTRVCRGAAC